MEGGEYKKGRNGGKGRRKKGETEDDGENEVLTDRERGDKGENEWKGAQR